MQEISEKDLNSLITIVADYCEKKQSKYLSLLLNKLDKLKRKYSAIQLREELERIIDLLSIVYADSPILKKLKEKITNLNFTVSYETVYGYYASPNEQVMAVKLPLKIYDVHYAINDSYSFLIVSLTQVSGRRERKKEKWASLGFQEAIKIPYEDSFDEKTNCKIKTVRQKISDACLEAGFQAAEEMPFICFPQPHTYWLFKDPVEKSFRYILKTDYDYFSRYINYNSSHNMGVAQNGIYVLRNIKDFGFWKAYKWWENCRDWYREMHPDWFEK